MKKVISVLLAVLLITVLFAACKSNNESAESKDSVSTTAAPAVSGDTEIVTEAPSEPEAEEGIYATINGVNVTVGVPFADMEAALGEQTQPAETIDSCDPDSDWKQTMHYYEGVIITENKDGIIDGIQVQEGDSALMGKIKIGAARDDVKALLGEPETDETWGMFYETKPGVNLYLDEETGLVSGFAIMYSGD